MAIRFPDTGTQSSPSVPTYISDGETFRVPAGKQVLFALPIQIEGDGVLDVDGYLVEVD